MNKVVRIGSLISVFNFLVATGFCASPGPARMRAASDGEARREAVSFFERTHSFSCGAVPQKQKPLTAVHLLGCRAFDPESLQDPRRFIACIQEIFEEREGFLDSLELKRIPARYFTEFIAVSKGVDDGEASSAAVSEVALVKDKESTGVLLLWGYLLKNNIFALIKAEIAEMNEQLVEATSCSLLGTSVHSGGYMMDDLASTTKRNAAVVAFIEEQEARASAALGLVVEDDSEKDFSDEE